MKISFTEPDQPHSGAVVVGIWEEGALTPAARRLDEATSGAIARALSVAPRFGGKKDELLPIVGPASLSVSRIVLAGLGKPDSVDARSLQQLGGKLVAHLNGAGEKEATFAIEVGNGVLTLSGKHEEAEETKETQDGRFVRRERRSGAFTRRMPLPDGVDPNKIKATTHENPTYVVDGVIHYGVANMPGGVPRTSTLALTNATFPYALQLANKGWKRALADQPALLHGLNIVDGHVTYPGVAEAFGMSLEDPRKFIH